MEQQAADEWAQVDAMQDARLKASQAHGKGMANIGNKQEATVATAMTWVECRDFFFGERPPTQARSDDSGGGGCCGFRSASKLSPVLMSQQSRIFEVAQLSFDNDNVHHQRLLQTVYMRLTGASLGAPRFGSHWEEIGFQGSDPATDLRGVGMLGLVHILQITYLNKRVVDDIFQLSKDELQNFPFSIMSLNLSKLCLQALREGRLAQIAVREGSVITAVGLFHLAAFSHLRQLWRAGRKTIQDSGFVLNDVTAYAKKNPAKLFADLARLDQPVVETHETLSFGAV